jgi:EmrB/QacA subfamily drug resistance transporter
MQTATAPVTSRQQLLIAVALILGVCAAVMEATLINLALPTIMRAFAIGQSQVQLLSTAFLAAGTASMLVAAWAAARFGIRRSYNAALWLFVISSILGACSPDGWFSGLLLARIGQGAAAGLLQPLAMMQLFASYAPEQRGRALAMYGLGIVLAPAIGPVLSGILVDIAGWRGVFVITLPLCVASGVLVKRHIPPHKEAHKPPFDGIGLAILCLSLVLLFDGLPQFQHTLLAQIELAGGLLLAMSFIAWQLRHPTPLLNPELFRHRRFAASAAVSLAYGAGLYGSTFLVPMSLQLVAGFSGAQTGLILLPSGLMLALALQLGGHLTDRGGAIQAMLAGLGLFSLASFLLGWQIHATLAWIWIAWTCLSRIGLGLIVPALNQSAVSSVPSQHINQATATTNFLRQLGGALGVSLISQFLAWRESLEPLATAFAQTYVLTALIFLLAMIPGWRMTHSGRQHAGAEAKPPQIG